MGGPRLTKLGRRLARLPIDPRLGRMILEAERLGCVRDVVVIAAALSLQDPRERPVEQQAQADQLHARFTDATSDFLTWLNLWRYLRTQQRELSSSAFRRMCRREFLNYLRVREWQDFESQLRQVCKEMKVDLGPGGPGGEVDADGIHQALLAGLLSHIGLVEERDKDSRGKAPRGPREYLGARGARFAIFPGSALKRKNPQYLMSAELVETSRLWARQNAAIRPEWAERLGEHLIKRSYSEPHWSAKRAAVMAHERVTLYGVPLAADRLVNYGKVDPELARELFIRHALVYGEWRTHHRFYTENLRLLAEAEELEHRARRRGLVVDEHTLFDFYDARVGRDVVGGAHFDKWWKAERRRHPDLLTFDPEMLTQAAADEISENDFPTSWRGEGLTFPICYHFEPGTADDGLTIDLPVATMNRVAADDFSWNVPGLRVELVTSLIRSLPKNLRVNFVPAPNTAREFLAAVPPGEEPLLTALERYLRATTGVVVPREAWDLAKVPDHLQPTFRVVDDAGQEAARGKDLEALKEPLRPQFAQALAEVATEVGRDHSGQRTWTFGTLEDSIVHQRAGHEVVAYPALIDEGDAVGLAVFGSADEAAARHRLGVRRLVLLAVPSVAPAVVADLEMEAKLGLAGSPYASVTDLMTDLEAALVADLIDDRPPVRAAEDLAVLVEAARADQRERLHAATMEVVALLDAWRGVDRLLSGRAELPLLPALSDMRAQLGRLVHAGFLAEAGSLTQLRSFRRYLAALRSRRERLPDQVTRDRQLMDQLSELQEAYLNRIAALPQGRPPGAELRKVRWQLEEYRVSLWAQHLGTAYPISDQRIRKTLDAAP